MKGIDGGGASEKREGGGIAEREGLTTVGMALAI